MMNTGISLASGKYITFLLPGSFYLGEDALGQLVKGGAEANFPEMIYAGSMKREAKRDPVIVEEPFSISRLKNGGESATLVACLFRTDLF